MKFKNIKDQTKEIVITIPDMPISRNNYQVSNNIITNNVKGYGFPIRYSRSLSAPVSK